MRRRRFVLWAVCMGLGGFFLLAWIDPYPREPSAAAMKAATTAMTVHRREIAKTQHWILIDYDRPVFAHRLWLIDGESGEVVLRSRVSHAFLSGPIMAVRFTNEPDTHTSCKGAFVTRNSYHGRFGYAMRVAGLEPGGNDNALARAIVFHSHWFIYWSGGCFVTPREINKRLVDTTHGGTFVYVHRSRD